MKEIYDMNQSYADVLCFQDANVSETYEGLNPSLDGDLIHRILMHIRLLDKETTCQSNQVIPRSMNFFATKGHMLIKALRNIGIRVDTHSGNIFYTSNFEPMLLDFELVFVRHGETFGNAGLITSDGSIDDNALRLNQKNHENRIFQGNVDTPINQLTDFGKQQAIDAAIKLENELLHKGWIPDIIFHSPLQRTKATGLPFVKRNGFEEKYHELASITEMSFGSLENRRVCDIPSDHQAHSFYKKQHALIKCPGEDVHGSWRDAENFCQVLLRARHTLQALNEQFKDKKVLIFSHSMVGAACCIMMGKGNLIENGTYLAFDGKRSDGTNYTMPNASPFLLNVNLEQLLGKHSFQSSNF
jgi:broad specificity phosphatase PhoE